MKRIITAMILVMFVQPVSAKTVLYCMMNNIVSFSGKNDFYNWEPERFTMSVDSKQVEISGGSYLW